MNVIVACIVQLTVLLNRSMAGESPGHSAEHNNREALVLQSLAKMDRDIYAIHATYLFTGYSPTLYPPGYYLYREVFAKRPDAFYQLNAHGHDAQPWFDDVKMMKLYVHAGSWISEQCVNRSFSEGTVLRGAQMPPVAQSEFLLFALGIWPANDYRAPTIRGEPYMLRDVAVSKLYRLRSNMERVKGVRCDVLERPGADILWLDAEHPGALVARETYDRGSGALMQRLEFSAPEPAAQAISIPRRIRNIQYDWHAKQESERRRHVIDALLTIQELELNENVPAGFVFTARPGMIRVGRDMTPTQVTAGGTEHLDELAEVVSKYYINEPRKTCWYDVWIAMVVGLAASVIIQKRRAMTQRKRFLMSEQRL